MVSSFSMHHIYTDEELLRRLKGRNGLAAWLALREFKKLLARREVELLMAARRAEVPWLVIATHLGVSPQAVHQRWKRLVAKEEAEVDQEFEGFGDDLPGRVEDR